jgi:nitrogen fixation/metabolism regulation signal transduction histidine kinase
VIDRANEPPSPDIPRASSDPPDSKRPLEAVRREAICWLLSGLMHESRNALQQIGSCAEMLAIELADHPQALDLVEGVEEAQSLLVRILNDLRTYSAPPQPACRPIELAAVWRQAWHELTLGDRWPEAILRHQTTEADTRCHADPALLAQTFATLFRHVLDAAGSEPTIEIACHEVTLDGQPALTVSIVCPGRQWTSAEQQQLFEPFFCHQPGGSGLELAIARCLVELHGGRLEARCGATGAEFVLTLPRRAKKP